jgi:hypothetical protein
VLSPHVRAKNCTIAAARIVRDAAEAAGAPKGLIQWVENPSTTLAAALMRDPGINLILATGTCCCAVWQCWHTVLCGCVCTCSCDSLPRLPPPHCAVPKLLLYDWRRCNTQCAVPAQRSPT